MPNYPYRSSKNPQVSNFVKLLSLGAELFHVDRRTDGQTDRRTDGQTDRRTDGQTDRRTDGQTDTDRRTDMKELTVAFLNFANKPKSDKT